MAKLVLTGSMPPTLQGVIEGQEIRGVTYNLPTGPVAGYEWRLLVRRAGPPGQPDTEDWTPWIFGSQQSVQAMLNQWSEFLRDNPPPQARSLLQ